MRETLLDALRRAIKEDAEDYAESLASEVGATIVEREIVDQRRWYNVLTVVFERPVDDDNSEYVRGTYHDGATELQEDTEKNWSFDEVKPVLVTTTKYVVEYE